MKAAYPGVACSDTRDWGRELTIRGPIEGARPNEVAGAETGGPVSGPDVAALPSPVSNDSFDGATRLHPYPPKIAEVWLSQQPGTVAWSKQGWDGLDSPRRDALGALGYSAQSFAATQGGDLRALPDAAKTLYDDLDASQRVALSSLGYDARTWNRTLEARQDILEYPDLLTHFVELRGGLRGSEQSEGNSATLIDAKGAHALIEHTHYFFGLMQDSGGKRALAYLRDFESESFTPEARAVLTKEINEQSWYSFSNLGWVSAAEPERTSWEAWRSDSGGADVVNDASGLSAALVLDTVNVESEDHLRVELGRARFHGLELNVAGARHSEGGHTCVGGSLNVDMSGLNGVEMLPNGDVKVGAGATWQEVIKELKSTKVVGEPFNRTVQIMQASNVFSVGGSISVNCHGRTPNDGPISTTVRSMRILKPDGEIVSCSRQSNPELFELAVGGYGAAGIILEATLKTVLDRPVEMKSEPTTVASFPAKMAEMICRDDVALGYGRIDPSFTASGGDDIGSVEAALNFATVRDVEPEVAVEESGFDFEQLNLTFIERLVLAWSKRNNTNLNRRWELEEKMRSSGSEGKRSDFLDLGVGGLRQLPWQEGGETDILEELFVPFDPHARGDAAKARDEKVIAFVESLRDLQRKHDNNSLNITVRYVKRDEDSLLPYTPDASEGCLAFVLYYNHPMTNEAAEARADQQRDLFDLTTRFGGKVYLPYQMHYTREQLLEAYPNFDAANAMRRELDVDGVLGNKLFSTYGERA